MEGLEIRTVDSQKALEFARPPPASSAGKPAGHLTTHELHEERRQSIALRLSTSMLEDELTEESLNSDKLEELEEVETCL